VATQDFFEETLDQSKVKSEIVVEYFFRWAVIISGKLDSDPRSQGSPIGYVDLFAGPGRYQSGAMSTPLLVLQTAIADPSFSQRLITIFNDADEKHVKTLQKAIESFPGIEKLAYPPEIWNEEVGTGIAKTFEETHTIPLLAFIDPWGYKGLSLGLVAAFLKDWGCECIFFFNYNRINAGLTNPLVEMHMAALFGDVGLAQLQKKLQGLTPDQREPFILGALIDALQAHGHRFVSPFCFKREDGVRTSHYLIFVSKHFKGYDIMKSIMGKHSSDQRQGVPTFTYVPPPTQQQLRLLDFSRPLDDLREMLLAGYAGRTLTLPTLYEEHSPGRPYLMRNYTAVLAALEQAKEISVKRPPRGRKGFFGKATLITFPVRQRPAPPERS
jgi:three-Cys-motif partner protein